jgi:uncharacterized protein (TIGR02147 family)
MKDMPDVFAYSDHRKYLTDAIADLRATRKSFSLRWLARKCGFSSHTYLPRVLSGDRNLTLESAARVADAIGIKGIAARGFLAMLERDIELSDVGRQKASKRLESLRAVHNRKRLESRQAKYYAKWYYPVIRQLAIWAPWKGDWTLLAGMVDPPIHPSEAQEAIETLVELELISKDEEGNYKTAASMLNVDRLPAHAKRKGREDILRRGMDSLVRHAPEERHTTCVLLAMSNDSYRQAVEIMTECAQRCLGLAAADPKVDKVWQMGLQLFPASKTLKARP